STWTRSRRSDRPDPMGGASMSGKRCLLSCLVLAAAAGALRAAPPLPLDLIPEDACIGVAIRDLAQLRVKSAPLFARNEQTRHLPRPSQLLDMAFMQVNLPWKIDEKKAGAIVCLSGRLAGFAADSNIEKEFRIGLVLAGRSPEEVARAYNLDVEDLKKDK